MGAVLATSEIVGGNGYVMIRVSYVGEFDGEARYDYNVNEYKSMHSLTGYGNSFSTPDRVLAYSEFLRRAFQFSSDEQKYANQMHESRVNDVIREVTANHIPNWDIAPGR